MQQNELERIGEGPFKLNTYLKDKGIQKKFFAKELGISSTLLSSCINGNRGFSKKIAKRIEELTQGHISCISLLYPKD